MTAIPAQASARPGPVLRIVILVLALVQPFASLFREVAGVGQTIPQFAEDGSGVLRAAGYAFAVWGLIYAACMAYGVYQAWPRRTPSRLERRLAWPAAIAFATNTAWVIVAQLDIKLATAPLILLGATALVATLLLSARDLRAAEGRERWLVAWPLGGLAGWLTVAAAINAVTLLAAENYIPQPFAPAAFAAIAAVAVVALTVVWRTALLPYAATVVWGAVAVIVAEAGRQPLVAAAAALAAMLVAAAAWAANRRPA